MKPETVLRKMRLAMGLIPKDCSTCKYGQQVRASTWFSCQHPQKGRGVYPRIDCQAKDYAFWKLSKRA